ncbi:MAG: DUF4234 domain-containing protein [Clostridia bacterium]|nr:DUF4234 domain-containing protein [Clostridia bacterium]
MNRKVGVILSYVLMIFEVLSTLLLTPFIISTLGDAEYGVYKLSASIVAYLLLLDLGVGNAVTRYVAKYRAANDREQCRKFLGITTIYYSGIALLCLIGGAVLIAIYPVAFAKGLTSDQIALGQQLLSITMINAAVTLGMAGFKNTIIAYERFDISRGISILSIILRMGLTVLVLTMGMGSIGIVTVNLCLTIATCLCFIGVVIFKFGLKPVFKGISGSMIRDVFVYSSFILIQMVATQVNAHADSIMLGAFVASSAGIIAIYSIGQQVTQYFQSIGSSVNGVLMPGIVKMVERGAKPQELCDEMVRIGRMIFMVLGMIWCGFLVYGQQFLSLWVGPTKMDAFLVALLLMTAYLFILTESIGTQILWAMNEHKEQSILKISIVAVNIVFTYFLIQWRPLLGATIGTVISLTLGDIFVMNLLFVKKIKISLAKYYGGLFKGILPCLAITGLAGFGFSFIGLSGWLGFAVNVIVMVAVYAVAMLLFGMNAYEKHLVFGVVRKITSRRIDRVKWGSDNSIDVYKQKIVPCILLSIVTLGIYRIYWTYLLVKNMRSAQENKSSCTKEMLCLVFVPYYSLYWWITRGKILKNKFAENGYTAHGNEITYLILSIFGLEIVSMAIMQNDFNSLPSESAQSIQIDNGISHRKKEES